MSFAMHEPQRFVDKPASSSTLPTVNLYTILIAMRCWWHVALPLGLLLAAAAAVIVYYTTTPKYTAQAWLLIQAKQPFLVNPNVSLHDPYRFVQNQTELIKSPMVLAPVASDAEVARTPELIHEPDPVKYIRNNLYVVNQGGSDLFTLEFGSQSPEKAKLIVDKVAQEYKELHNNHEGKLASTTIEKLKRLLTAKGEEVKSTRHELEVLAAQSVNLDAETPNVKLPWEKQERARAIQSSTVHSQWIELLVDQAANDAMVEAAKILMDEDKYEPSQVEVEQYVKSHEAVQDINRKIESLNLKLEEYKKVSVNPQAYAGFEKQVREAEALRESTLVELRKVGKEELKKYRRNQRQERLDELRAKQEEIRVRLKILHDRLELENQKRPEVAKSMLALELAKDDHIRAQDMYEALQTRIQDMQTELDAPARVEIRRPASLPTRADEEVPYKNMAMFGLISFCIPFGLAIGVELLYRRVSSRQQLESTSAIAVVAEVTSLPARVKSRRAQTGAIYRDRQLFEESIDGLRTYLSLVESMRGRKVLAVTSAISREGKTSLASQLAVSVASATGRPTLLIDGDLRSPDVHRIFDVDRGPGLSEVLQDECSVEDAIETGFSDTLHLLTAGELQVSPHRILGNSRFVELLRKLSGMYDHIILDTPPILAASEALLMASAADAAILCVRRDFSRVDQVADAFARLGKAGVKTAGAVLNGIPARHYAYRYGAYYYNRDRGPRDGTERFRIRLKLICSSLRDLRVARGSLQ